MADEEFKGLAPRYPDVTDTGWIMLYGSPSITIGSWFDSTPPHEQ